jgi:hypothetical protein
VSHGLAVAAKTDGGTVVYAGRNLKLYVLAFALGAFAAADRADFFRNFAGALAFGASSGLANVAKNRAGNPMYLTRALALIAFFKLVAGFNCRALAVFANVF